MNNETLLKLPLSDFKYDILYYLIHEGLIFFYLI